MLGMRSKTPRHLLLAVLAVLAVMRGRVDGAMRCHDYDGDGYYYLLEDTAKCWAREINAALDGKLDGCDGNSWVEANSSANCQTTVANINKSDKYKGPPIQCGPDYDSALGWKSADDCSNGIKALMDFFNVFENSTSTTTTTRTTRMCNEGCIPKGVKRKDGQPDCCTEGTKTLKCPEPAHYHCGAHALRPNQTAAVLVQRRPSSDT